MARSDATNGIVAHASVAQTVTDVSPEGLEQLTCELIEAAINGLVTERGTALMNVGISQCMHSSDHAMAGRGVMIVTAFATVG